jgi:hypothetical protein
VDGRQPQVLRLVRRGELAQDDHVTLQGQGGDAAGGVKMAGLYGPGSGSAVFLVHAGSPRQAPADHHPSNEDLLPGAPDEREVNPAGV